MKVIKFGSSALADATKIKQAASIASKEKNGDIVVVSSREGTHEALAEIADYLYKKNQDAAREEINTLERSYLNLAKELFGTDSEEQEIEKEVSNRFDAIRELTKDIFTLFEEKKIVAQGELLMSLFFGKWLKRSGVAVKSIPALNFVRIDKNEEPDSVFIKKNLANQIEQAGKADVYVTEGFICRNAYNEIDNLKKGGSDYTASLIGAALKAKEIEIWSDKGTLYNMDERIAPAAKPVEKLNFEEAEELAYFSDNTIHPTCLAPAKLENIGVRLLNTNKPESKGTLISTDYTPHKLEVVATKDKITSIRIKSGRMLFAHGFTRRVFEVFEQSKTAIDMITTSEVGIAMTIDNDHNLDEIVDNLKKFGTVSVNRDMTIICGIGDLEENKDICARMVEALKDVQVVMMSYGASANNISFLIHTSDKAKALKNLAGII